MIDAQRSRNKYEINEINWQKRPQFNAREERIDEWKLKTCDEFEAENHVY